MILHSIAPEALDAAAPALGAGSVTMMNLIWFREKTSYPAGFSAAQPDPRSALYQGYAMGFMELAGELGVEGVEAVLIGHRAAGLVAGSEDDWDDIVVVRYRSFADFRKIVESEGYAQKVRPHHHAAAANWRLIAIAEQH